MKRVLAVALLILGGSGLRAQGDIDRWWAHVVYLADDAMQGRQTGSPEHRKAAEYVADQFRKAGLKPGNGSSYLQPVEFVTRQIVEEQSSLTLIRNGVEEPVILGEEAMLNMRVDHAPSLEAPLVFAGHGLVIPEIEHDDLSGLDLKGKVAVVLTGLPPGSEGPIGSHYSQMRWQGLRAAGAVGTLQIQNPKGQDIPWERQMPTRFLPQMALADRSMDEGAGQLLNAPVNPARAEKLFAGSGHTFKEILDLANAGKPLPRFPLPARIRSAVTVKRTTSISDNVVGILPGTDPKLKDEYVVVTAHLDHLGTGNPVNGDGIYNGAMDNASGIATLIEAAAAAGARKGFKRSIAFVAVTAEEKGLLGSRYFAHKPTIPERGMVANLNTDMFLPLFPMKTLVAQGLEESDLAADLRRVAASLGIEVMTDPEPERNAFTRSDQYSFIRRGIPALSLKVGFLKDSPEHEVVRKWRTERYHSVRDDLLQPVDKQAAVDFNRVYVRVVEAVANRPTRPSWNSDSFFKRFAPPDTTNGADEKKLILERAETVTFTTDEGTWMSLDVSPDGRTIAFDLLGDIYTLPVAGGEATRIVGGMSFDSQPRFSPDGKRIAFLSDRSGVENLWTAEVDGANPKAVTTDAPTTSAPQIMSSPAWTPDGDYLVVSKARAPESTFALFLYHRDGGTGVRIGSAPPPPRSPDDPGPPPPAPKNRVGAVVSPDGRFIYYTERTGNFSYNTRFPLWQVIRFDRETGDTATITNAQGSAMRPVLSPDGAHMVYATRFETGTGLRVRDLKTGDERWLLHPVTRDDQESRASRDTLPGYAFLPDGRSLAVPIDGRIKRVHFATGAVTDIPFSAKVEAEIAPRVYFEHRVDDSPSVRVRLVRWPALSPDGSRVIFSALNKLWVMDLPSGTPRRLTSAAEGEFMPAWSPDGRYIAYVTWSSEGGHVYRVGTGGGQPERLTRNAAWYSEPAYTPDGRRLVVLVGSKADQLYADLRHTDPHVLQPDTTPGEITGIGAAAPQDLYWLPAEGGDLRFIASSQGGSMPHFADDPERVYLSSSRGLTSVRLDGYDRRTHVQVTGTGPAPNPPPADQIRLSPDGKRLFVELQNRLLVLEAPRAGRETIKINVKPKGDAAVPVKRIAPEGGDYIGWSHDGKAVLWALGNRIQWQELAADAPQTATATIEVPRAKPSGTVVLSGARVATMKGDEIIERADVVVTGNRIAAVGPKGRVTIPAGARIIDVTGKTIAPGFVDVHAHMWPPRGVHQPQVWYYLSNLAYGVTTTRDPQTSTNDVFAYADLVEAGEIIGPRVLATGPGVFVASGLDDEVSVSAFLKRYRESYGTDTIKSYIAGDRIVRQWVIKAAAEHRLMPTTEGALDMKLDLSQMIDGFTGLEHSLPIQPIYRDVAQFVAKTRTYYTPTILVAYGAPWSENYYFQHTDVHGNAKLRRFVPHELLDTMVRRRGQWFLPEEYGHAGIAKGVAAIVRAGGRVGLGSHGQLQGLGAHWEIWNLQSGGLTPHETLKVATIFGAEALGLQRDLGSVESGKLADLVVYDRNPLADIRNTNSIRYVMKNGELFEGDTLNQIWPSARPLPKMYWMETDPPRPAPQTTAAPAGRARTGGR